LAVYPIAAEDPLLRERDMLWWTMILAKEALLGLALGTLLGLPLALFEGLGAMIDTQSGANSSSVYNPLAEAELGVWAGLLRMMGATLIVSTGLLAASVELGLWSYRAWPVSVLAPPFDIDGGQALALFQRFMEKLLLLAFPVVFVLLLLELAVGRMARPVPQLNVFTVAMPVKAVAAVMVLMIELLFLLDGVVDLLRFPIVAVRAWLP
jgi:type III secretion protein T